MLNRTPAAPGTVTTKGVSDYFQVTGRTVANWRAAGRIPFIRITARCIRYKLADVEKALATIGQNKNPGISGAGLSVI